MKTTRCDFTVFAACVGLLWTGMAGAQGLAQCSANLGTCATNLGTCATDLGTCATNLGTCPADLAACQAQQANFAPVPQTGQTTCWDTNGTVIECAGTGQDGDVQAGVVPPTPRFTDNGNGTITDNLTGLIWLRDGQCLGAPTWDNALAAANALADGNLACNLTDQSMAGDWRLPNRIELLSLISLGNPSPPGGPFLNYNHSNVCTSTTLATSPEKVWRVSLADGQVLFGPKSAACGSVGSVTAVRDP